jgi:serine protease AprX
MSKNPDKGNSDKGNKDKTDATYASDDLGGVAGHDGGGAGVDIAVVDTGVSDTAALSRASGRLVDGVDTSGLIDGGNVVDSGVFTDGYGHGTFMADIIAGGKVPGSNTNLGVAPGATIHVVKVANDAGEATLFSVLVGLNWVAAHADTIDVANLALGMERPMPMYGADPLNVATHWVRSAGITVVAAAGNTTDQVTDPGFAPGVLTVGAADTLHGAPTVAAFSGSAIVAGVRKPDVVAPGVSVLSLLPATSVVALANPQSRTADGLYRGSGTSQAAAVVSGLAAIYLAANPGADTTEVKSSLRSSTKKLSDSRAGAGFARTVTEPGDRNGTGEQGFDQNVWVANALVGAGGTIDDWLLPMYEAWFAVKWSGSDFEAVKWSAAKWSAAKWSAAKWSAAKWSAAKWSAAKWTSTNWTAAKWSAVRWSTDAWGGVA